MNLFLETPQQAAERLLREQQRQQAYLYGAPGAPWAAPAGGYGAPGQGAAGPAWPGAPGSQGAPSQAAAGRAVEPGASVPAPPRYQAAETMGAQGAPEGAVCGWAPDAAQPASPYAARDPMPGAPPGACGDPGGRPEPNGHPAAQMVPGPPPRGWPERGRGGPVAAADPGQGGAGTGPAAQPAGPDLPRARGAAAAPDAQMPASMPERQRVACAAGEAPAAQDPCYPGWQVPAERFSSQSSADRPPGYPFPAGSMDPYAVGAYGSPGPSSAGVPYAAAPSDTGRMPAARAGYGAAPGQPAPSGWDAYSMEQEAYRDELEYNRKRAASRKRRGVLKVLATIVLVPIALVIAFIVSYVLTCIINGASPEDIAGLLANLLERVQGWVHGFASLM